MRPLSATTSRSLHKHNEAISGHSLVPTDLYIRAISPMVTFESFFLVSGNQHERL